MKSVDEILLTAIALERYGQEYYHAFSKSISDKKGKDLMNGLARDEMEHEDIIAEQYKAHSGKSPPKSMDINLGVKAIKEIFIERKKGKMESDAMLEVLQIGIITEQKSVDFYSSSAKSLSDAALKETLEKLVGIEKEHKKLLEENLFHLRQEGSWWGYTPILEG